jgi:4-amino-4-deoxychorismate lyase
MLFSYRNELRRDLIGLPVAGPAFRFGCGIFETIFFNGSRPCHLDEHVGRLVNSLRELEIAFQEIDFAETIEGVVKANGLWGQTVRVNIFYPVADEDAPAWPVVAAAAYLPAPKKIYRLDISPGPRESALCCHKTHNRMDHFLSLRRARQAGCDEVVLLDRDGFVLEASGSSLLFARDGAFMTPSSPWKLPGIAQRIAQRAIGMDQKPIHLTDLAGFDHVYLLNSLIGARPAGRIGKWDFPVDWATCDALSRLIVPLD